MQYFQHFDISCNTVDTAINKQPINNQFVIVKNRSIMSDMN